MAVDAAYVTRWSANRLTDSDDLVTIPCGTEVAIKKQRAASFLLFLFSSSHSLSLIQPPFHSKPHSLVDKIAQTRIRTPDSPGLLISDVFNPNLLSFVQQKKLYSISTFGCFTGSDSVSLDEISTKQFGRLLLVAS